MVAHGRIGGVEWISSSHFKARLELPGCGFRQPSLDAQLRHARRFPGGPVALATPAGNALLLRSILSFRRSAVLKSGCTPLDWADPPLPGKHQRLADCLVRSPFYIYPTGTGRPGIAGRMSCVVSNRELEFLAVSFRPRTPHFSVTFSLEETLNRPSGELAIFDSLRELAETLTRPLECNEKSRTCK